MDAKTADTKKSSPLLGNDVKPVAVTPTKVVNFVGDIKDELHKITWTTPEELRTYTKIVVGMMFFLGLGLYVVDVFIQLALSGLNTLFRLIS